MALCSWGLFGFWGPEVESLDLCFSPNAYVGGMNLSHKIFFARWDFLFLPSPPNTWSVCQQGLSQREVCCLPVEEVANSKLKWVNAVVKEKHEGCPVPLCAASMGNKWLMLWTVCYRLLTAWDPTVAADVWPVIQHCWSMGPWSRKNAGMWSRRRLLPNVLTTGKCPKHV